MICKPYNAVVPESTCITRQHIIATGAVKNSFWFSMGPQHLVHDKCKSCRKGKALYAKAQAAGTLPVIQKRPTVREPRGDVDFMAYQKQTACLYY